MVFKNIHDLDLTHIFECGQCFRWVPDGSGAYTGAAGSFAARISADADTLTVDATGGDEAFWRNYFDLDTDYGSIKSRLIGSEPRIKKAAEYGYGIRILNQDPFETIISFIISLFGLFSKQKKPDKTEEGINKAVEQIEKKETAELASNSELVAVIAAAIAAYEGTTSTDGFVVRSIKKIKRQ